MAKETSKVEDMWSPFKELQSFIEGVVSTPVQGILQKVQEVLRRHKQNFLTFLKNPPKNVQHREELRKGITEGILLPGIGHQMLSKELVDEAIIISDMYDLNEYVALDLLCTAQQRMPNHPGLPRGLVAVLLYYDGRRALVYALRALVQARNGISWTVGSSEEVSRYITRYTQELVDQGILNRVLGLVESLDLTTELELLQQNRAIGGPRHHRQILDLFQDIRQGLADVMYCWAAQSGLPRDPTFKLINLLKKMKIEDDPTGGIDGVTLALQMALLYAVDLNVIHRREDGEDLVKNLPLLAEADFLRELVREMLPAGGQQWECSGLQALTQFALALSLVHLRRAPQHLHPTVFSDEDDILIDSAIELDVFDFLHRTFLQNDALFNEAFYIHRLHTLVTDFIMLMPFKVKELRNRADETARTMQVYLQEGLEPPSKLPHHYEHMLLALSRLYHCDRLNQELVLEYWNPSDDIRLNIMPFRNAPRKMLLSKFIYEGGTELMPSLFVPHMKMMCSLASTPKAARYAFNYLKNNTTGNVSWNHFFRSLERYYTNLRQELPPTTDTVYQHRSYPRGITPQEILGLQVVLDIIKTVADHDPVSRVALCENNQWSSMSILLGLVTCSVPIPLKAELLRTLAALAKSPETAVTLWFNLETSQILSTVPGASSYQPRGVQTELEEIESRNEEYPLTRALLHLLDVLTDVPVPRLLGLGNRAPGFDPYLNFVVNSVFLRFNTRTYKNPEEKWEVAKGCLKLFVKLLAKYEPQEQDFTVQYVDLHGGGTSQVNSPPGYHLMINLSSKTELLRLVLYLIEEGVQMLDSFIPFPGKEALEATLESCLALLDRALTLQAQFSTLLSASCAPLIVSGLNRLLLGVNPRTGQTDYLLLITKYVTYANWLPQHSFLAVKILLSMTSQPSSQNQMVSQFTSTFSLATQIRQGFVECLEANEDEVSESEVEDTLSVQAQTKELIMRLLQQSLGHPQPNLAHYLFGFDLKKNVKNTVFYHAGVKAFPRTCLHVLISILDASVTARTTPYMMPPQPRLLEACFAMLYALCANTKTGDPVLNYLRTCSNFLARHLSSLQFGSEQNASELNQMAWLLKIVAIELRGTAATKQVPQLTCLVDLLVREPSGVMENLKEPIRTYKLMENEQYLFRPKGLGFSQKPKSRQTLLVLLRFLDFQTQSCPQPTWEFFDPAQISQLVTKCEVSGPGGIKLVDVKRLHQKLMEQLQILQNTSNASQRPIVMAEIQEVLKYVIKLNKQRQTSGATIHYMDSWRQVAEVMFTTTPLDILPCDTRQEVLLDAIQLILWKVMSSQVVPKLSSHSSGTLMLLLVNLRKCYKMQLREDRSDSRFSELNATLQTKSAILDLILTNIIEWILGSGAKSQNLRANLYGSLLNFLHIACHNGAEIFDPDLEDSLFASCLDTSRYRSGTSDSPQRASCLSIVMSFGERLVDVLCHDCTGGHDVCKMLALSCVGLLMELNPHTSWTLYLSSRGYLKYIVDSLLDADSKLVAMLEPVPSTLSAIYIYESKMAMLCRVASSHSGAEMLLEHGLIGCLASMTVFDRHPDINQSIPNVDVNFIPSVSNRYLQILMPALDLCDAVLTSLGTENQSCCSQILHFLLSHNDVICTVLRAASPSLQPHFLKEVARITGLIARCTGHEVRDSWQLEMVSDGSAHLQKMRKLMLALLPRFVATERILRELEAPESVRHFLQTACHLALHTRNLVASRGIDARASVAVLRPSLGDPYAPFDHRHAREMQHVGESCSPSLGVMVYQLVQTTACHRQEAGALELLRRQQSSLAGMSGAELKQFLPEDAGPVRALPQSRALAARHLSQRVAAKEQELRLLSFLLENALYLVWTHLDYYMLRSIPKSLFGDTHTGMVASSVELSWQVTAEDISLLKQGLVSIFNDSFSKQLVETKKDLGAMERGFVEALLRRIKRLIQFVPVK